MHVMPPMLLRPIAKGRAWGGATFVQWGKFAKPQAGALPIGESWELADLQLSTPGGSSEIETGIYAGQTLHDAIHHDQRSIMGRAQLSPVGRFPLLVKFLDTAEHLSVQVHPSEALSQADATCQLKNESWMVLHAQPGARIWRGIRAGVAREQFHETLRRGGDIIPYLIEIKVRAGDCIHLPSGLCHALGEGITVAEIQTPSDTTFRVFDWNRNDSTRPLHIDQALASMLFGNEQQLDSIPVVNALDMPPVLTREFRTTLLLNTRDYRMERLEALQDAALPVVTHQRPSCWIVLAGGVAISEPQRVEAGAWRTLLVPAAAEGMTAHFKKGSCVLRISVPDPMDRWIA